MHDSVKTARGEEERKIDLAAREAVEWEINICHEAAIERRGNSN